MPCDIFRRNVRKKQSLTATAAGYFPQGNYLHDSPRWVTNTKQHGNSRAVFVVIPEGSNPRKLRIGRKGGENIDKEKTCHSGNQRAADNKFCLAHCKGDRS